MDDTDRKEVRKIHRENIKKKETFIDEETKFRNKSNKVRKYRLAALEEEELYDEWEDYFK